ncbi:hypothetical protein K505DRAFT_268147 [Melanomma pulvis-pyrius CBS 109.77]|uniref:Clr5 domain-containing protein n=1 Tax=Melanomma pulvis-pyrius CBS 109.77 TaxID=1314802 RepID=A0A6A6XPN0_9PLEO|nr:hypothetical protein K505DRAFT_268147 [Melanomma pulvis-pyrius CBS 109.77]
MDMPAMFANLPSDLPKPSSFPSPDEVRQKARGLSKELFADWIILNSILERREDSIRKRWGKKSKEQKKKILLTAWPNMESQHRPDVEAWRKESGAQRAKGTKFRAAYMWPYINLEDLLKPKPLLIFLNSRGRNPPYEFVHSDLKSAALGETLGATTPGFLNEYTMHFHGRNGPEKYGELVSWDDDEDAFDNMINGLGMHPGHGLQALEIQQHIWRFLVSCCKQILQDLPLETLMSCDVKPDPGSLSGQDANVTSLELIALEAPYRVPAHLDFSRLKSLASAERNSREDHLWDLREDPGYFAEVMRDYEQHRSEMILDKHGQNHPTLTQPGRALFWNRILGNVVVDAYFGLAKFDAITQQISGLNELEERYRNQIQPQDDLPMDYLEAFQNLRFMLSDTVTDICGQLKSCVLPSPPMREFCYRNPQDPNTTKISTAYSPPSQDHAVKRIMPLFEILWDDEQRRLFGVHTVTDEIERLIQADPDVGALISPLIATRLSSLSVVSECLHQLHLYQPWARKIEDGMELKRDELLETYKNTFQGWIPILRINFESSLMYRYADPSDGKFTYPVHRRRSKDNVESMRNAEANLDEFWKAVDRHYKSKIGGKSQHDMVAHLLSKERSIQRTPQWTEPVKHQKTTKQPDYTYQPFSSVYHDPSKQITGTFDRVSVTEKSTKTKTKGTATLPEDPPPAEPEDSYVLDQKTIFTVDRRAYKAFNVLFYSPSNPDLPGEIPWLDFLHAMKSTGFSAEKLYGSAWNFVPSGLDVERSIQFHDPHPSSKLGFYRARRYGRRLERAYGWKGDMFRLA